MNRLSYITGSIIIVFPTCTSIYQIFNKPRNTLNRNQLEKIMTGIDIKNKINIVENEIKILSEKAGVKKLEIVYTDSFNPDASATFLYKKNLLTLSPIFLLSKKDVPNGLKDFAVNSEQRRFVIAHEIGHLSNEWNKRMHYGCGFGVPIILGTMVMRSKNVYTIAISSFVITGSMILEQRYFEKRADLKAAELLGSGRGGIEFFKHSQKLNIKYGKYPYLISRCGDDYKDYMHPLLSTRIKYLLAKQKI